MKSDPKSGIMKVVEMLRQQKKVTKSEMARRLSSRTRYYEHLQAKDITFETAKMYLNKLGYDLIVRDRETNFERKL